MVSTIKYLILCSAILLAFSASKPDPFDDLLLWGTYKPYLLASITQKSKAPISLGFAFSELMKVKDTEEEFNEKLRYRMRRDSKAQYSYHNGFDLAIQRIEDTRNCLGLNTTFAKEINNETGQQSWHYLIESEYLEYCNPVKDFYTTGFGRFWGQNSQPSDKILDSFFYIALQDLDPKTVENTYLQYISKNERSILISVNDKASNSVKGYFRIDIFSDMPSEVDTSKNMISHCLSNKVDKKDSWKVESIIYDMIMENTLTQETYINQWKCVEQAYLDDTNFFLTHIRSKPGFKILVAYNSNSVPELISSEAFTNLIIKKKKQMKSELHNKFPLQNVNPYRVDPDIYEEISRFAVSNLLGGILYSYGRIKIINKTEESIPRKELFTASPSRVGFPRGFLWDEGFHQTVICRWNSSLCTRMIKSWLDTTQENGWIPREQARGDEIESNFKQKEYLTQSSEEANPPSMMLAIEFLLSKFLANDTTPDNKLEIQNFFFHTRKNLKNWHKWFVTTHLNTDPRDLDNDKTRIHFKWNCKQPCVERYFASGLDDYPRTPNGYHPVAHVDLHSWVYFFTRMMNYLDKFFNEPDNSMIQLESNIALQFGYMLDTQTLLFRDLLATNKLTNRTNQKGLSPHTGYVNLFPIFFGLLEPNSTYFDAVLKTMTSRDQLWSNYGLRSLSKSDTFFMQGDQYWTEPIWIPMNYLALRGLKLYYTNNTEAPEVYTALRELLMENNIRTWKSTHNFWENYDSFDGHGKGFPSFTGWTTLMILIYSEQY